jgi:MFS family permease
LCVLAEIFEGKKLIWGFFTHGFGISKKKFLAVLLLFFPSFAWFFLFEQFSMSLLEESIINEGFSTDFWINVGHVLFFISIIGSAIIGSVISGKWRRRRLLEVWILLGVITTLLVMVNQGVFFLLFISVLAGVSFGLGFPYCLAFFAESTTVEERARVAGALIFTTFFSTILCILVSSGLQCGIIEYLLILSFLRAISFFSLLIDPHERIVCKERGWMSVITTSGLGLYYLSWLIFSVAAGILTIVELPLELQMENLSVLGSVFLYFGVIVSSLFSGFAADHFGRKKIIMLGSIMLGVSYTVFGIAISGSSYLLIRLVSGVAWGIIFVTYMLTVVGDLATNCSKEKFYAIGVVVPIIVFMIFQSFSGTFTPSVPISSISVILSILLFISVIPLLYAPETLPIDKIRQRRFEKHLKKIKKLVKEERNRSRS